MHKPSRETAVMLEIYDAQELLETRRRRKKGRSSARRKTRECAAAFATRAESQGRAVAFASRRLTINPAGVFERLSKGDVYRSYEAAGIWQNRERRFYTREWEGKLPMRLGLFSGWGMVMCWGNWKKLGELVLRFLHVIRYWKNLILIMLDNLEPPKYLILTLEHIFKYFLEIRYKFYFGLCSVNS